MYVPEEAGDDDLGHAFRAALTTRPRAAGEAHSRANGPRMHLRALPPNGLEDGPITVEDSADEGGQATLTDTAEHPPHAALPEEDPGDAIQQAVAHANGTCRADCAWCRVAELAN